MKQEPALRIAFAYQLLFESSAHELFPAIYAQVGSQLAGRARTLARKLRTSGRDRSGVKRGLLRALAGRNREQSQFA